MRTLTKSKYILGVQCPASLWIKMNDSERIPETSAALNHIFEQGTIVGEFATKLYSGGIRAPEEFVENIEVTRDLLKERNPIFEAGFMNKMKEGYIYARIDILVPAGKDGWDIIEVKSGTKVKDINLHDVAFQKYVCEKEGLKVRKCFVCFVNKEFVKKGKIKPSEFFIVENVSENVGEIYPEVEGKIKELFKVIKQKECPDITAEDIDNSEYTNVAIDEFFESLPEKNIFELYGVGPKIGIKLYEKGIVQIKDLPDDFKLNEKQKIQKECSLTDNPYINRDEVRKFLGGLKYPLYYLDFETFSTVIPMFDNSKSNQVIPFQFSLHIVKKKGEKPKHISFLADGRGDPRLKFMQELKDNLGDKGSIVVYHESFEKDRIKEGLMAFPEFEEWGADILERILDLKKPFSKFYFYDPKQNGSASLKDVFPVFSSDVLHKDLAISEGNDASVSYFNTHFKDVPEEEKERVRKELEEYCSLDTWAEVVIVKGLGKVVG